jgi:hypothetical protein
VAVAVRAVVGVTAPVERVGLTTIAIAEVAEVGAIVVAIRVAAILGMK